MWQQYNTSPEPRVHDMSQWPRVSPDRGELVDEGARRDDLHAYMSYADAPRAVQPSSVRWADEDKAGLLPVTPRNPRFDYTGWHRMRPVRREPQDRLHQQLGAEFFDEPELESAKPAVTIDPGAVVKIGDLARSLERGTDAIRNWIEQGTIPPAPIRLGHGVRAWPAAEAAAIVTAARRERILSKPRRPISETNFSLRCWDARTQQQMRDDRERGD